jgi:shikimate 5-dehydrogenase
VQHLENYNKFAGDGTAASKAKFGPHPHAYSSVVNRTRARAQELARELGGSIHPLEWRERNAALEGAALVINTTNQGMVDEQPLDIALDALPRSALVSDIVYRS